MEVIKKEIQNAELTEYLDITIPKYVSDFCVRAFPDISPKEIVVRIIAGEFFANKALYINGENLDTAYLVKVPSNVFKHYTYVYMPEMDKYAHTIVEISYNEVRDTCYIPDIGITWEVEAK